MVARAPTIEQQIAAARRIEVTKPEGADALREILRKSLGFVVAVAAARIAEHSLVALVPDLVACFERLCEDGAKRDPGCGGKRAIVKALHAMDWWDDRVFVRGLRIVQREGWAGPDGRPPDDTAADLRGMCGVVHAQLARADALDVLAELLHDDERATRVLAANGIGDSGRRDGTALLRYKLLAGDPEAEVLSACFEALFSLAREDSVAFALRFLDAHDEIAEVAVLALGSARIAEAFEPIKLWCSGCRPPQRHAIGLLALALLRADPATDYLLDLVRSSKTDAVAAARALATFIDDRKLIDSVRAAAKEQRDSKVQAEILALL